MNQPAICPQCGGSFEAQTITHQQPWGEELYEFENVPALVCVQCREVWLGAEVAQLIESVNQEPPPTQALSPSAGFFAGGILLITLSGLTSSGY
jgi:YgiT-type zinc finger domain-containing protein